MYAACAALLATATAAFCCSLAAAAATAAIAVDENGYVVFCPCMGRFGNQVETFLGTLEFTRQLNRTLVLAPFLDYPIGASEAVSGERPLSAPTVDRPFCFPL